MTKVTTMQTARASLCALGEYLRRRCFFAPLVEQVKIAQKVVKYRREAPRCIVGPPVWRQDHRPESRDD